MTPKHNVRTTGARGKGVWIAIVLVLALFALIVCFDWNWFRGPLERFASQKTERSVTLEHLDVHLAWPPVVHLRGLRVGGIQGSRQAEMISADEVAFAIEVRSLFSGSIVIPHVWLVKPDVHLERLKDGRVNWTFGKPHEPSVNTVEIRDLSVDHGALEYSDSVADVHVNVKAETGPAALTDTELHRTLTTRLTFAGSYGKVGFDGFAETASVLSLNDAGKPFAIRTEFNLDKTRISADGTITNLLKPSAANVALAVSGPSLGALYPALPVALPATPKYHFKGQFVMQGNSYAYENFKGVIGKSDIAGDATYVAKSPRPHLQMQLHSKLLALADLGPTIGAPASKKSITRLSQERASSVPTSTRRVLPQQPFKLDRLNAMDANVTLDAKQLQVPDQLPLEDLSVSLRLEAGRLELAPLRFGMAGGNLVSTVVLDARQDPLKIDANIEVQHALLAQLFPTSEIMRNSKGAVGARLVLNGRGNSIADFLGDASGSAQFAMSGGTVSNLLMEVVGLDGGEVIKFLVTGDATTPIRCAAASFKVTSGVAKSEAIVFDTEDTIVGGNGYVDMKKEYLDILLTPQPKDRSILTLRVPIRVHGNFAAPTYAVKKDSLLLRGGAVVALAFLNPLAAILPLIEFGPGSNSNCAALMKTVRSAKESSLAR
ncbi:MAG TPA: AsmA family protein [Rhodocyclaceae bacterium]|nr:AsmA family protein [Rhodocyclaceae bacterium]